MHFKAYQLLHCTPLKAYAHGPAVLELNILILISLMEMS